MRAIVNNQQSEWSNAVTGSVTPEGLWLIQQGRSHYVQLDGDDINDWSSVDEVGVFKVHGRQQAVLIRSSLGALEGSFTGVLRGDLGRDIDDAQADLARLRRLDEPVLLIATDYAAKVRIFDVTDAPHPETKAIGAHERIWRRVSFRFVEADDR